MSERNLFKELMGGVDDMADEREAYSSIKQGLVEAIGAVNQGSFVQGLESKNLKIPSKMTTKEFFQRDLEGLLYFIQKQVFKEVYGYNLSSYELDDLQEKIDKLEEDGGFPVCYYRVKEYIKKEREDATPNL